MSIVTKVGDNGKTMLCHGRILVAKDTARIEACGTIDELGAFLGMTRSLVRDDAVKSVIKSIQKELFLIGAEIATPVKKISKLKSRISESEINHLERTINGIEAKGGIEKLFCISGEDSIASSFDICRTVARRAERRIVTLMRKKVIINGCIVKYLNRLSDLLYLLARSCEKSCSCTGR